VLLINPDRRLGTVRAVAVKARAARSDGRANPALLTYTMVGPFLRCITAPSVEAGEGKSKIIYTLL